MEKREFKKESENKSVEVSHKGAGVQSGTLKIEQVRGGSRILCRTKFGESLESWRIFCIIEAFPTANSIYIVIVPYNLVYIVIYRN